MIDNSSKFVVPQAPQAQPALQAPVPQQAPAIPKEMLAAPPAPAPVAQQHGYSLPTDFVKLPSAGKFYPVNSSLHNKEEVEITYMTTKQEDILSNPSLMSKGTTLEKLIESLLVDKSIRANELLLGDRNAILIAARASGYGPAYGINVNCVECFNKEEITIDLNEIKPKKNNYEGVELTGHGTFVVQLPRTNAFVEIKALTTGGEAQLAQLFMKKMEHNLPPEPVFEKHRATIASVGGRQDVATITEFISNMPISDSKYLQKKYNELIPDMDFIYRFSCERCDHQNEGGIPVDATFFWPDD